MGEARLYCKRQGDNGGDYCVSIRDDKLILTLPLHNDPSQLWYKDGNNATGFMLLNKATGKAVQYSGVGDQLRLVNKPYYTDQSVLWTESGDVGDGYTFLRTWSDVGVVMDAWEGKIFDGSSVSIYPNSNSDNEHWKLTSYTPSTNIPTNNYQKLYCKQQGPEGDYCVAVRYDKLILTRPNDSDPSQLWYKESYNNGFMLVNKATNKPVQYNGVGDQLQLVNKPNGLDQSVLWTESGDVGGGYTFIRTHNDVGVVMDAWEGKIFDGSSVSIYPNSNSDNEHWKLTSYSPSGPTPSYTPTNNYQKLYCKQQGPEGDYCVAVRYDKLILTRPNDSDPSQLWYKESYNNGFMLVNKATNKPVQYNGVGDQLQLVNKPNGLDQSVLWTESGDVGGGYTFFRTYSDVGVVMDAWEGKIFDGSSVSIYPNSNSENEHWKLTSYTPSTQTPSYSPTNNYQKLYCKQQGPEGDYCVAVRYDKLILTRPNDSDPSQLWYKESYNNGFMLVNKATNKTVQYNGVGDQLQLVNKPNGLDQSVLWTESGDVGGGYTFFRTYSDVGVVMDAWEGKIFDGSSVSIYPNSNSDNEHWKLTSYSPSTNTPAQNNQNYQKLYCKQQGPEGDYCVAVRYDKLILTRPNDSDPSQLWYKESYNNGFMLVNKATNKPVQYNGVGDQLQLVNKPYGLDQSVLWTESEDVGGGYTFFRTHNDVGVVMDAWEGKIFDGSSVSIYPNSNSDNEHWKLTSYTPSTNTSSVNNHHSNRKLYCRKWGSEGDYCVAVRGDKLILTRPSSDPSQLWYKENYNDGFMLVNKATNKPVQYNGVGDQLQLVNKPNYPDQSVLWTESGDVGEGYTFLRTLSDAGVVMDAWDGKIFNGTVVSIYPNSNSDNEHWKLA